MTAKYTLIYIKRVPKYKLIVYSINKHPRAKLKSCKY